jgi:hypothetical protein
MLIFFLAIACPQKLKIILISFHLKEDETDSRWLFLGYKKQGRTSEKNRNVEYSDSPSDRSKFLANLAENNGFWRKFI